MLATPSTRLELEQENARLQRLVAELLARNQELRQASGVRMLSSGFPLCVDTWLYPS